MIHEDTRAALSLLLARLTDDDGTPGYERLRLRLVGFFRLRFPAQAEALADEVLDRLARRLADGTAVESPAAYALGIARLLLLETDARQKRELHAAREAVHEAELHRSEGEPDPAILALRACLETLSPETAVFILDYYSAEGGASRIERRQRLAKASGSTLNALRNRALRIRSTLEKCVRARVGSERAGRASDENANFHTRVMSKDGGSDETDA